MHYNFVLWQYVGKLEIKWPLMRIHIKQLRKNCPTRLSSGQNPGSSSCYRGFTVLVVISSYYPVLLWHIHSTKITSEAINYNNYSVSNMCGTWNVALVGSDDYTKQWWRMELPSRDHTHISPFNSSSVAVASSPRTLLQRCSQVHTNLTQLECWLLTSNNPVSHYLREVLSLFADSFLRFFVTTKAIFPLSTEHQQSQASCDLPH